MAEYRHFIVHKPFGYLTQFIYNGKRKQKLLGDLHDFPEGTMAIGRLDKNSEGLLLLTTNGITSAQVRSKSVEKEYYVQVDGIINAAAIEKLRNGVEIGLDGGKYLTLPCKARKLDSMPDFPLGNMRIRDERHGPTSWASVTVTEGKFKQVRKMTAAVGFPTLRLVRFRIGNVELSGLAPGEVIEVDQFDIEGVN